MTLLSPSSFVLVYTFTIFFTRFLIARALRTNRRRGIFDDPNTGLPIFYVWRQLICNIFIAIRSRHKIK